ncbi:hypothetical protein [Streptomyces sp. NPDC053079]|uniref:hypothetical protein n=1 Tax=Streptomyces sp. NPDC053079 TaxID=3365697 RepID=UPI0037CED579
MTAAPYQGTGTPGADDAPARKTTFPQGMTPFDHLYDQPDPRAYFRTLGPLEYRAPQHAQDIFRRAVRACGARTAEPTTVLDICCSYGINAALLNHDVTLDDLYAHYTSARATAMSTAELIAWDREYYAARRRPDAVRVTGLDVAANAVSYACAVGLLEEGFAENLETGAPSPPLLRSVRRTRLVTVTGGTSFLTARTFRPLLTGARRPLWVAALVLRTISYAPIAACLAAHGLVTEKLTTRTYPQRRFTDAGERHYAIQAVTAAGEDPHGRETDGYFHAALHLSRPPSDVTASPLAGLVPGP